MARMTDTERVKKIKSLFKQWQSDDGSEYGDEWLIDQIKGVLR